MNFSQNTWVIVAERLGRINKNLLHSSGGRQTRAILHVMNNDDVTKTAKSANEAIKKLFPGKKVFISRKTVTVTEVEL